MSEIRTTGKGFWSRDTEIIRDRGPSPEERKGCAHLDDWLVLQREEIERCMRHHGFKPGETIHDSYDRVADCEPFSPGHYLATALRQLMVIEASRHHEDAPYRLLQAGIAFGAAMNEMQVKQKFDGTFVAKTRLDDQRVEMAREFLRRRPESHLSDSRLKQIIGQKYGKSRTTAHDDINRGLSLLQNSSGRGEPDDTPMDTDLHR